MRPFPLDLSLRHLVVAMVTPFTADGDVDVESLRRLTAYLQHGGIREFFVLGSTGESPLLDEKDRLAVLSTVRAAAPEDIIYAGVSGTGHRHAIRNAQSAAAAGADVAVIMSPFFVSLDQDQLANFCLRIADGSPIPVALYHHLRMPTPFAIPTVARLAAHPNIIGIKDTNGGDQNRCAEILSATAGQEFLFFQGVEKLALPTLEAGGHGCVVALANVAPRLFRSLFDAWQRGETKQTAGFQERITALWGIFSRPEVRQSFLHFLHTMKLPLHERGVLASTASSLPGVQIEESFSRMVSEFMRQHGDADTSPAL